MAANNCSTSSTGHDVSDQPRLSNGQFTFKGSATAATRPSHRQQAALEAPMPVSQSAPLAERMYPASVADVVKKHAQGDHATLQPYVPDPDAPVPYYRMGVRELGLPGDIGERMFGGKVPFFNLHFDHMHFVGSEGSNFGLTGTGEFSEPVENLKKYQVEAPKYRKEYIDRARLDVAQEWEKTQQDTVLNQNFKPPVYSAVVRNCQHYFAEVLQHAQKYETREKPLVLP